MYGHEFGQKGRCRRQEPPNALNLVHYNQFEAEVLMIKCINLSTLLDICLIMTTWCEEREDLLWIVGGSSARLSMIAEKMPGHPSANYKSIQRFLQAWI
jgi:hypothetical protein